MNTNVGDSQKRGDLPLSSLLYIQGDGTLLVQSNLGTYEDARPTLLSFSELMQRLDPIHVYQIRPISLWQASSLGLTPRDILGFLRQYAAHPVPFSLQQLIVAEMSKWGLLTLQRGARKRIVLRAEAQLLAQVRTLQEMTKLAVSDRSDGLVFPEEHRATVKRVLAAAGYPVIDQVGYQAAPGVSFSLCAATALRDYQAEAVQAFLAADREQSGVVVLPCGAGKTLVGIAIAAQLGLHTLVLTPSESAAQQWSREFLQRTSLSPDEVSLYEAKRPLTPVTITTYQRVAARKRSGERVHLANLTSHPWGIVIYDEVHMLPAPLFRLAADLQGARRLGLTATLVREDGAEADVFSLIGPKVFEVPWKQLERAGYLAAVRCVQVRVPLSPEEANRYEHATVREQYRLAALGVNKIALAQEIVATHSGESTMVIGHYLESLRELADVLNCPLVTGETPQDEREVVLEQFRSGATRCIVLSRVANMAVDLPCASIAIQVSGLFGSRQEEAQRLGRLLRPQTSEGVFYSLVSQNTVEEKSAQHRQLYLVEQGYTYDIRDAAELYTERMTRHEAVGMPERC